MYKFTHKCDAHEYTQIYEYIDVYTDQLAGTVEYTDCISAEG